MSAEREKILVIKLSALGDFIMAMGPFRAIRAHHPAARITLLTTPPYAGLAKACGYFDEIWADGRPQGFWRMVALLRRMSWARFDRVYDLQTSQRTNNYYRFLWPKPEWSGIAPGCSHPHANPGRKGMHTMDQQAEQLEFAGIPSVPMDDLAWASADVGRFDLPARYALLVPGGAPHRPAKRWPAERYGRLAEGIAALGVTPVILGGAAEKAAAEAIMAACPQAINLVERTSFEDIVVLARRARFAVGNDTGPMHLVAMAGCPCLVLFSADSRPAKSAPRGAVVCTLQTPDLKDLSTTRVWEALQNVLEVRQVAQSAAPGRAE